MKIKVVRTMRLELNETEFRALTSAAYCGVMTNRMIDEDQKLADDMLREINAKAEIEFRHNDETPF